MPKFWIPAYLGKNLFAEYNKLLIAERDLKINDAQKKELEQMREMLKQNRKFAEKVIKYLWDDAFKFKKMCSQIKSGKMRK